MILVCFQSQTQTVSCSDDECDRKTERGRQGHELRKSPGTLTYTHSLHIEYRGAIRERKMKVLKRPKLIQDA